ncbi:facilitated trehalose transporter Tret1-2 homolog isoform X2 [Bombus huntii]|nr:facilitated trehalose transporter Tret1-2 homolog isoform X2 [Bombus huntii]XP_050481931.1 facilitated trehalose transporter Tret1-2 homolog isoform X2 [Bombus huntii]
MEGTGMINDAAVRQESRKLWQYLASISACILVVGVGTALAWTSPVLPQLYAADSWLVITKEQGSWISSLLALGAIAGALGSGSMADKMGRKKSLLLLSVPFLASWGIILVATEVKLLYIARFLVGIGVGAGCVLGPTYISEISEVSTRGTLGALFQLFLTVGIFVAFILGSVLNYTMLALVCALIVAFFLATFYWMPESPVWLVNQNRKQEATSAMSVLRGEDYDPKQELNEMQKEAEASAGKKPSLSDMAKDPINKKAMIASFGMMFFQQASGVNAVIFYTVMIFEASGSSMAPELASILVALVQLVMSGVAALIVDRAGRKPLLMISTSIMSVSLIALGYYFQQKDGGNDVSSLGWLPLASLIVFMVAFSIGLGPVPWMLMGELFAAETKAVASSVAVMLNWLLVFIVTKTFPMMNKELGTDMTFWIFAVVMACATAFTHVLVPETKGKTYQQIHDELQAGEGDCWSSLAGGRIAKRARVGRTDEARFAGRRKHEGRERRWSGAYRTGPCTCERQERAEATRKERGRNRKGERNGPHPRPGGNRGAL